MGRRWRSLQTEDETFFITTTVVGFANVFVKDTYCDILINNIKHYQRQYSFSIYGYVIMPSHFHWIIRIQYEKGSVSDIMRDIKKYSAWDILNEFKRENHFELLRLFEKSAQPYPDQQRKFWMNRFDSQAIDNPGMMRTKLEYIHNNPVKARLVENPEDYKYSSARNYYLNDNSVLEISYDWM